MALRLMGQVHPLPAGVGKVYRPLLPVNLHRPGGCLRYHGGTWTQRTISSANFDRLPRSPVGLWVLSMANLDEKTMDSLGTLWKSNWEVFLSSSAHHPF